MHKDFDSLTITDDFIFCHTMQDKTICSSLLRMLLPDALAEITAISYQKSFDQSLYAKGIRLDVWAADTAGKLYDIEMQTANAYNLAKRLRYYQAVLDISTLEKGTDYEQLHDSFLIFFCTFDYLAKGLPVYTFKTVCSEDMRIRLPDAITKVIVNSSAAEKDMMLRSFEMDARRAGFQQGITQGMRQGEARGSRQAKLETARLMMQRNYPVSEICLMTGLSKEEIEKL